MDWLLVDVSGLCHRAYHTTGKLTEGVVFGFMRDIQNLADVFVGCKFVFCFDSPSSNRAKTYPGYKQSRRDKIAQMTQEELDSKQALYKQMRDLYHTHLYALGYYNVWAQPGYEADDGIAVYCDLLDGYSRVIISEDGDLYQLLGRDVIMWRPSMKRPYTADCFRKEYHIEPAQWPEVKALAGCGTDDIPGVPGVGDITAIKYLSGKLKSESKAYAAITAWGADNWRRNIALVRLPYAGALCRELVSDDPTPAKWRAVASSLGMRTLVGSHV